MPHVYSYAHRAAATGLPMMQALGFAFSDDPEAAEWEDQYLFGEEFLVAPIYSDDNEREVYLPRGHQWFDYWTGAEHRGGEVLNWEAPLDVLPLFVRDSSVVASSIQRPTALAGTLCLTFYPGPQHELHVHHSNKEWTVSAAVSPPGRDVTVTSAAADPLLLVFVNEHRPSGVEIAGRAIPEVPEIGDLREAPAWFYRQEDGRLFVFCRPDAANPVRIKTSED